MSLSHQRHQPQSVFHPGELYVQNRAGTRGAASELGLYLGNYLDPSSTLHSLFSTLRVAWLSSVRPSTPDDNSPDDVRPRVWVTPVFGDPGFIQIVDPVTLVITLPNPLPNLYRLLCPQNSDLPNPVSFLALDMSARRRYRTNGFISQVTPTKLILRVAEAFPNCPKYIQRRRLVSKPAPVPLVNPQIDTSASLSQTDIEHIRASDTFFLGTHYQETGTDVSHRGGQPGFVRVESPNSLFWPDYRGNGMFQSFGNIHQNNRVGLTFLDFSSGMLLQLTGLARIDWDRRAYDNVEHAAERVVHFDIDYVRRTRDPATHLRWRMVERSPYNPLLAYPTNKPCSTKKGVYPMTVALVKISSESENVKTFRFVAPEQISFLPGQYATFEFAVASEVEEENPPLVRTWTISEAANSKDGDTSIEVSIRRKKDGVMSNWMHDHARVGDRVVLRGVDGDMTPFRPGSDDIKPGKFLMISAGIGITPNMAIIRGFGARLPEGNAPDVAIIHQERDIKEMPFRAELSRRCVQSAGRMRMRVFLSGLSSSSTELVAGRVSESAIRELVADVAEREVYLCGPPGFMKKVTGSLSRCGVASNRIVTEKFDF